jgi:two-component system invasion response regulator UvrY
MIVAGEASDGRQALELLHIGIWDVVLLDMSMPGLSGVELIKQLKTEHPKLPILILSMHKEEEYTIRTIRAGAAGYLCKDSASQELLSALRKVAAGGHYISAEVASELAFGLIFKEERQPHTLLSDREFQIFRLITSGCSGSEISKQLYLSAKTISTYKTRILQKMQMRRATDLIRYGLENNLIDGVSAATRDNL